MGRSFFLFSNFSPFVGPILELQALILEKRASLWEMTWIMHVQNCCLKSCRGSTFALAVAAGGWGNSSSRS